MRLPEFDDLVITTEGIGSLLVGQPVDRTDMVTRSVDYCAEMGAEYGYSVGDARSDRWFAAYPSTSTTVNPFTVTVDATTGTVQRIDVLSAELNTDQGVFVGAPIEILNAAYPDLQTGSVDDLSEIYFLTSDTGVLVFEVAVAGAVPEYWDESEIGTIFMIRVVPAGADFNVHTAATDNLAGSCV